MIVRDHDDALLERHTDLVRRLAAEIEEREPAPASRSRCRKRTATCARRSTSIRASSRPREEAIRRAGVEPVRSLIRGGTDGARLSEMGLPTPEHLHRAGRTTTRLREWASVQDMAAAAATIVELVRVWAEPA